MRTDADKPIRVIKSYPLKAVIWRNEAKAEKTRPWYSVEFIRTYKDENGDYQDARSFSNSQLLQLAHLSHKAFDAVAELEAADYDAEQRKAA